MNQRINKILSGRGVCSRREADRLIEQERVSVNGEIAVTGQKISVDDRIEIDGQPLQNDLTDRIYIILNKPIGLICTSDRKKPDNVVDYVNLKKRIYPIGRLDVQSSGLLLLTNDGELANRLTHPSYGHEKEYSVTVNRTVKDHELAKLAKGIQLEDGQTRPAKIRRLKPDSFLLTLREGRNRQIRRMCQTLDMEVTGLHRIRVGNLKLGDLPVGDWRNLTEKEIESLTKY